MDQTVLVDRDIQRGAELLAALDRAHIKIYVALWANLGEYEDWRLVLAARAFDEVGLFKAYGLIDDALSSAGIDVGNLPIILILEMTDPSIRELRRKYGKHKEPEAIRLALQVFGDRFVNDAHVYRIR